MAENRLVFLFNLTFVFLLIFSSCNGYQLYRDSSPSLRPIKYHGLNDPDRHIDRMKQYHNTVAQLRLWRRYIDNFNDHDDDMSLQEFHHLYKFPEYYKR